MATLKMNDPKTPSQVLVADAQQANTVVDSTGRSITLQKPGLLAQYRLVRLLGGEAASNQVYMNMVLPITFVTAIDGVPVPTPNNQAQLDALIQRLDEHGLTACVNGLNEFWGGDTQDASIESVKA